MRTQTDAASAAVHDNAGADAGPLPRWLEATADHVRRRFGSRAIVTAVVDGRPAIALAYVYVLSGGGLVLVPEPEAPTDGADQGEAGATDHMAHAGENGTGRAEVWLSGLEQVVFEVKAAADGEWNTGFGLLGLSRTPRMLVVRGQHPPAPRDPHDHGDF